MNNSKAEKLYIYKSDVFPLVLVSIMFAIQLYAFINLTGLWELMVFSLLSMPFLTFSVAYSHHHAHISMSNSKWLNGYVNRILSLQVWINHYAWKLHHNHGHHLNYMNQYPLQDDVSIDESNWTRTDGSKMNRFEYTIHLAKTTLKRVKENGQKHEKVYKKYMTYRLQNYTIYFVLFLYSPLALIFVFIIPPLVMSLYTFWLTYPHHSGLRSSDPYKASRSIISPLYNFWFTNLGYHTAHHIRPNLHWSLLPNYHESIKDKIPEHLIQERVFPAFELDKSRGISDAS